MDVLVFLIIIAVALTVGRILNSYTYAEVREETINEYDSSRRSKPNQDSTGYPH